MYFVVAVDVMNVDVCVSMPSYCVSDSHAQACPECGAKQSYDEVKEKRKFCPNCRVEYCAQLSWAKVSNKFFKKGVYCMLSHGVYFVCVLSQMIIDIGCWLADYSLSIAMSATQFVCLLRRVTLCSEGRSEIGKDQTAAGGRLLYSRA